MPVIAIAGAAIAGAIAAPAVGGLIAGAGLSLAGGLEIATAVGATMSAVGAVTRDKGLTTAGAVIGGIGGIGSLASAAGVIDGSTQLFGAGAANAAQTAAAASADLGNLPAGAMSPEGFTDAAQGAMSPNGFADITNSLSAPVLNNAPVETSALPALEVTPPGVPNDMTAQDMVDLSPQALMSAPAPAAPAASTAAPQTGSLTSAETANLAPTNPGLTTPGGSINVTPQEPGIGTMGANGGYLHGLLDFAGSNPLVTYGAIQAGGAMISGMFNPLTPAQKAAMDAQAANNRAAAALTSTQTSNIKSGMPGIVPKAAVAPPTGKVGAGLLNTTPNYVTGAPAPLMVS